MADVEANLRAKVTVDGAKQGTVELNNLANAGDRAGKKLDLMDKFVGSANKALNYLAVGMDKLNLSYEKGDISLDSYNKKLDKLSNSMSRLQKIARGTSDIFNQFGKTQQIHAQIAGSNTREAAQANRFNTGNIAAQFQDVAVTSAMNMNPLTIGLQQGTQLAYVLGQSKAPLADFAAGVKNLISPVTLLSVGLTALVAVIIQAVDWVNVGKTALNGLASVFDWVGDSLDTVIIGLTAVSIGVLTLNDNLRMNLILSLTASYEKVLYFTSVIKTGFIPALTKAYTVIKNVVTGITAFASKNPLIAGLMLVTTVFTAFTSKAENSEGIFHKIASWFREIAESIGLAKSELTEWEEDLTKMLDKAKAELDEKQFENSLIGLSKGEAAYQRMYRKLWKGMMEKSPDNIPDLTTALEIRNLSEQARTLEEDAEAKRKNLKATEDAARAQEKLFKTTQNLTNSYKDLIASGWEKVEDMKFEQSIQGMSEYDQTIAKTTRDLEKQVEAIRQRALAEGVELPILKNYKSEIEEIAQATADTKLQMDMQTESLKLQDEVINFYSSTTKSFFSDMKSGLKEGQSAWEAFGNAVLNILDKIADKMMNMAVDAIFNGLQTDSAGNKNQGFLGSLISGTMKGVMSAQMPSMNVTGMGNISGGNVAVTNASYTGPFAKGGAFSNGVYNSPTMFAFANGGKFGVMGEAGPEAVMPLTRRSDGSLGVRADGIGGGSPVVVNVINNSNAQARTQERQTEQGTTIDVMIDEMVAQKLGQTGTASNQALTAFNNRQLIAR